jgi:hypothetical protein
LVQEVAHSKDDFLVQEVVALLMVQEVTVVEALLGRERQSER